MIIFGNKSKQLAKEISTDKCQNCGAQNCIDLYVFQEYVHIFWMPFFSVGKTAVSQCDHCKQILKLKEMPASLVAAYNNLKVQTRTPIWMFSGLILITVILILGIIGEKQEHDINAQLILTPKSGDIFEIITKDNQYTLYKIYQVQGDSVFIQVNIYKTNKISGLRNLKNKDYSEDVIGFTKNELKKMLYNGQIINIERN